MKHASRAGGGLRKTQYGGGRRTFDRQRKKNCPSRLHFFGMYHCAERENCRYRKWIRFESHDVRSKGEFKPHATQRTPIQLKFIGRFYTRGRIIRLDERGKTFLFVWLWVFSINTGTGRIKSVMVGLDSLWTQNIMRTSCTRLHTKVQESQ